MVNRVTLIGRLGADPELRTFDNGSSLLTFRMATNESYKDRDGNWQDKTEWHSVVAWRNLAERLERQLQKGSQVYIEGKLTHRDYEDRDGNKRYVTEVVAGMARVLSGRKEDPNAQNNYQQQNAPAPAAQPTVAESKPMEDDLPF